MVRGKPVSKEIREKIIRLHKENKSLAEIKDQLLISSRSTVQYVVKNFCKTGNLDPKKKPGRKPSTTAAENRRLTWIIRQNRRSTTVDIKNQWEESISKTMSTQTCRRRLKSMGYGFYKVSCN